jgi:hypothetical protein
VAFILLLVVLVYGQLKDNLKSFQRHYTVIGKDKNEIVEVEIVNEISVYSLGFARSAHIYIYIIN